MEAYVHNGKYGKYAVRFLPRFFSFKNSNKTAVILYSYDPYGCGFFKTKKLESFSAKRIEAMRLSHSLGSEDKDLLQEIAKILVSNWEMNNMARLTLPAIRREQKSYLSKI